jgi:hypothetical protein
MLVIIILIDNRGQLKLLSYNFILSTRKNNGESHCGLTAWDSNRNYLNIRLSITTSPVGCFSLIPFEIVLKSDTEGFLFVHAR